MEPDVEFYELLDEAFMVALLSIPPWLLASNFIDNTTIPGSWARNPIFKVAIAGGLFHIGAELSGFNDWYVDNGLARRKKLQYHYSSNYDRSFMGYHHPSLGRGYI